ncbi:MAG: hypothetical protein AAF716_03785 [Cyanobacteria bacterium P01_D01_bin.1]
MLSEEVLFALESSPTPASDSGSNQIESEQLKNEQPFPEAELSIAGESAIVADWTQVSLSDFPPLEGSDIEIENALTLGDLALAIDIESLTFDAILKQSKDTIESPTLSDYSFIADMQVSDLMFAIKGIESLSIRELRPLYDLLKTTVETPIIPAEATLSDVLVRYPNLASVQLRYLDLEKYQAVEIPGFLNLPVISIPDWPDIPVSAVPGLKAVPLTDIGDGFNLSGQIVSVGIVDSPSGGKSAMLYKGKWRREWSTENPLAPFGALIEIAPVQVEENSIATGAYFKLCQADDCRKLGPFSYLSYADRDPLFAGDISVEVAEQASLTMKRSPVAQTVPATAPAFSNQMLENALFPTIGVLLVLTAVVWLLVSKRKRRQR